VQQNHIHTINHFNCSGECVGIRSYCFSLPTEFEFLDERRTQDMIKEIQYFYHTDHLGSSSWITDATGSAYQHMQSLPFGEDFIDQRTSSWTAPYRFTGKERDTETGWDYFGARYYDSDLSVWLSVVPIAIGTMASKYPSMSAYMYCAGNPVMMVDPDGRDIIFIIDKEDANKEGHIAVLIGNEKKGWTYVSMNGTGDGAKPWGKSKNADIGTKIVGTDGKIITDPKEAILRANNINPNEEHSYDSFKRVISSDKEDKNALNKANETAKAENYGIAGPGKSCIDVAQSAFESLVKDRKLDEDGDVPGQSDLIPNNWFNKLEKRVNEANENSNDKNKNIKFVYPKKEEKKNE